MCANPTVRSPSRPPGIPGHAGADTSPSLANFGTTTIASSLAQPSGAGLENGPRFSWGEWGSAGAAVALPRVACGEARPTPLCPHRAVPSPPRSSRCSPDHRGDGDMGRDKPSTAGPLSKKESSKQEQVLGHEREGCSLRTTVPITSACIPPSSTGAAQPCGPRATLGWRFVTQPQAPRAPRWAPMGSRIWPCVLVGGVCLLPMSPRVALPGGVAY